MKRAITRMFKGLHYRSKLFYDTCALLKLGEDYQRRYQIASKYIKPGDCVVDVCCGAGDFKSYVPSRCTYRAIEASLEFAKILEQKSIAVVVTNLHQGFPQEIGKSDVIVMIIALYQFRLTSVDVLLESFKKQAKRVIIVEDLLEISRPHNAWITRVMNYLCARDYYVPVECFTHQEFEELMRRHGYRCVERVGRYQVGLYEGAIHD